MATISFKLQEDRKNWYKGTVIEETEFPNWGGLYALLQNKKGFVLACRSHRSGDNYEGVYIDHLPVEQIAEIKAAFGSYSDDDKHTLREYFEFAQSNHSHSA